MDELFRVLKSTTLLAPVVYSAGTTVLTFEYELALYPGEDKVFNLELWAPMPTFSVVPGGQVATTIQIPGSIQPFTATILEAEGYIPDAQGNPTEQKVDKRLDQDFGLRHIVSWYGKTTHCLECVINISNRWNNR